MCAWLGFYIKHLTPGSPLKGQGLLILRLALQVTELANKSNQSPHSLLTLTLHGKAILSARTPRNVVRKSDLLIWEVAAGKFMFPGRVGEEGRGEGGGASGGRPGPGRTARRGPQIGKGARDDAQEVRRVAP